MYFDFRHLEVTLARSIERNQLQIRGLDYGLEEIYPGAMTGKGGNSCVFSAIPFIADAPSYVVKFCKYPYKPDNANYTKRLKRFKHEMQALKKAKESQFSDHVIDIITPGKLTLKSQGREGITEVEMLYYVMEKADCDLSKYLEERDLSLSDKLDLVCKIAKALHGLHSLGLRHRDLKPDNIFFVGDQLKLGDLGLVEDQARDYSIDRIDEKIGPLGFLSPEAINKAFGDRQRMPFPEQAVICEKSDIYQLGLIVFFILQGEIPTGCLLQDDFQEDWRSHSNLVDAIVSLLQFRKSRRMELEPLVEALTQYLQCPS